MRKLIFLTLTAILSLSLASCESDPDEYIAYSLKGTWEGYTITSNNERTYTTIEFFDDPYSAPYGATGSGRWYDEYEDNTYFSSRFEWEVTREDIVIHLLDNGYDERRNYLYIDREKYRLNSDRFSGELEYLGGKRQFMFKRISSFDWDRYPYGYAKKPLKDFSEK